MDRGQQQGNSTILVSMGEADAVETAAAGLGGDDASGQSVDPGRLDQQFPARITQGKGGLGVADGLAVLAEPEPGQATADPGIGVTGIKAEDGFEVVQGQGRGIGDDVEPAPAPAELSGIAAHGQRRGEVVDGAGEITERLSGDGTLLEKARCHLVRLDKGIARP